MRLGKAITSARRALGYRYRTTFANDVGISVRSLAAAEKGEPTVGAAILGDIARFIPWWTEETPQEILEGKEPPVRGVPRVAADEGEPEPERPVGPIGQLLWSTFRDWQKEFGHKAAVKMMRQQLDLLWARVEEREREQDDDEQLDAG